MVVASGEQQAGLVAAVALLSDRSAAENAAAMQEALAEVRTGQVAPAARADAQGRFAVGDAVGYVGGELVAWGAAAGHAARRARPPGRTRPSS